MNKIVTPLLHVRYDGRSWDLTLSALRLQGDSKDEEIREALARYLEVPVSRLTPYVVERHPNGNLTVRPQAVFG